MSPSTLRIDPVRVDFSTLAKVFYHLTAHTPARRAAGGYAWEMDLIGVPFVCRQDVVAMTVEVEAPTWRAKFRFIPFGPRECEALPGNDPATLPVDVHRLGVFGYLRDATLSGSAPEFEANLVQLRLGLPRYVHACYPKVALFEITP